MDQQQIEIDPQLMHALADALRRMKFGTITLTIHEGAVVSIERLERTRLSPTK